MIAKVFNEICNEDQDVFDMEKNFEVLPDEIKNATRSSQDRFTDVVAYYKDNVRHQFSAIFKTQELHHPSFCIAWCTEKGKG